MLLLKLTDGEDQSVRGKIHDGVQRFSSYDFINCACAKPAKSTYGKTTFSRFGAEYKSEIDTLCISLHFPGQRGPSTPCMTIRGLQRLLMILGGKVAAEFRAIVESTFTRVMAGDQSLIEVINANAASQAPVQQAFRAALAQEPVAPVLDEYCLDRKRKLDELELEERRHHLEMDKRGKDLEHSRLALENSAMALDNSAKALDNSSKALELLKNVSSIDERTKLQFGDHIKNVILSSGTDESTGISVSVLALEMGYSCSDQQIQAIGRKMAAKYRAKYNQDPPKHTQQVKGNYVPVCSYTARDRPLMEQAVREVLGSA